jgi:hypothetical protein
MERNKTLQAELVISLENIKNQLTTKNRKAYEKELNRLQEIIQQSLKISPTQQSAFFEKNNIVKCIMKIINKIDKEVATLEKEMHGLEFYPSKTGKLKDISVKQFIKDELILIRDKVIGARYEMRTEMYPK